MPAKATCRSGKPGSGVKKPEAFVLTKSSFQRPDCQDNLMFLAGCWRTFSSAAYHPERFVRAVWFPSVTYGNILLFQSAIQRRQSWPHYRYRGADSEKALCLPCFPSDLQCAGVTKNCRLPHLPESRCSVADCCPELVLFLRRAYPQPPR